MRNQNIYNPRSNLRNLISEMESISFAAAALGINRQQLNKYLSGTSTPSLRSLSHIAARFKVPVEDLFLPPQDFQEARNNAIMRANIPADVSDTITRMLGSSPVIQDKLALYCGTYHRLCAMPMTPRKIMRAVTRIYQRDGLTYATTVEVFSERGSPFSDPRHMRKLHALILLHGDRIYFVDASRSSRIMLMIAYPEEIPGYGFLQGQALSVSDMGARKIFSIPFVLNRLHGGSIKRADLLACGIFDKEDPRLTEEELLRLSEVH
ncbi:helix-turn-helix transcriptional regulator [Paracoccus sp. PS-1]|uniref:helix-turn-helix transcriptional regulator n=1 Tax=unclassified Paracoccus (in: a-proteobacteria) TaxID=2688777 RepID=UPI000A058DCC|nr:MULTISPECIES: helix-turn-helix transcriptional regulator [unclassified Paracoccus (in: a-proteobacteria)]MDQ7262963.1 helix-turn-helix transcriptional regulator [Paracoccus sp. PS1]